MPTYKDNNGKWYCKFYFTDWNGQKKQKKKSGFKTQREAKAWERNFLESKTTSSDITMATLCDNFLKIKESEVKPKTLLSYSVAINKYVKPYFGSAKANAISPLQIKEYHAEILKSTSPENLRYINSVLSIVFNHGIKFYGLSKNPCAAVGKIKTVKKEMRFITPEEFHSLLPYLKYKYQVFLSLLFWTGLRLGEARALTAKDIGNHSIKINKNVVTVAGKLIAQKSPKTSNSIRTIEIHDKLYKMIKDYSNKIYDPDSRLFLFSEDAVRKNLNYACERAGIEHIRIHDLRHSHVSMLIHLGVSPNIIAQRIGDTVSTMLNVYAHIYDEDKRAVADKLQRLDSF